MLAYEDSQFHLGPSLKKRLNKIQQKTPKTNVAFVRRKVITSSVQPKLGKNTLLMYVNRAEDDVYRRLKDSETLREKNVTQR